MTPKPTFTSLDEAKEFFKKLKDDELVKLAATKTKQIHRLASEVDIIMNEWRSRK